MSDEKKYTEADLIRAKREGWDTCETLAWLSPGRHSRDLAFPFARVCREADLLFGEVHYRYRVRDAMLEFLDHKTLTWVVIYNRMQFSQILDLANNPTEERAS